jgi:predicted patatin/cPLA2 family phospholipase
MKSTALVLEGGGMRGLFSAGVLDFFLEHNLSFDNVYGVSAGACNATSYISKQKGRSKDIYINYVSNKEYLSFHSLVTTGDIFNANFAYNIVPNKLNKFAYETFKKSKMQMYAVATDIQKGEPVYFKIVDVKADTDKIRASASLPLVSNNVKIANHYYLDGGMSDPIPIRKAISDGNDKNVLILTRELDYHKKKTRLGLIFKLRYRKYPKFIKLLINRNTSYNNTLAFIKEEEKKGNIFVIRPTTNLKVKRLEKNKDKLINAYNDGYNEAKRVYKDLISYLNK